MNMLRKLDDFLIDKVFQPIADSLANRTTLRALAQNLLLLCSLITVWRLWLYWLAGSMGIFRIIFGHIFIVILLVWAFQAGKSEKFGFIPKERLTLFYMRIMLVFFTATTIVATGALVVLNATDEITILMLSGNIERFIELCGLYFMACRTNPPKRREATSNDFATQRT